MTQQFAQLEARVNSATDGNPEVAELINQGVHAIFKAAYAAGLTPSEMVQILYVLVERKRKTIL